MEYSSHMLLMTCLCFACCDLLDRHGNSCFAHQLVQSRFCSCLKFSLILLTLGDEERREKEDMRGRTEVMFGLQEASLNLKLTLKLTCLSFRVLWTHWIYTCCILLLFHIVKHAAKHFHVHYLWVIKGLHETTCSLMLKWSVCRTVVMFTVMLFMVSVTSQQILNLNFSCWITRWIPFRSVNQQQQLSSFSFIHKAPNNSSSHLEALYIVK